MLFNLFLKISEQKYVLIKCHLLKIDYIPKYEMSVGIIFIAWQMIRPEFWYLTEVLFHISFSLQFWEIRPFFWMCFL